MSTTTRVTADQLFEMPDDGHRYELVAGELRKMVLSDWKHGAIGGQLNGWLARHIQQQKLGRIFCAETGFLLARDPDTVRAPDFAFIHKAHLPAEAPEEAFWPGAPDLAVEVLSPKRQAERSGRQGPGMARCGRDDGLGRKSHGTERHRLPLDNRHQGADRKRSTRRPGRPAGLRLPGWRYLRERVIGVWVWGNPYC